MYLAISPPFSLTMIWHFWSPSKNGLTSRLTTGPHWWRSDKCGISAGGIETGGISIRLAWCPICSVTGCIKSLSNMLTICPRPVPIPQSSLESQGGLGNCYQSWLSTTPTWWTCKSRWNCLPKKGDPVTDCCYQIVPLRLLMQLSHVCNHISYFFSGSCLLLPLLWYSCPDDVISCWSIIVLVWPRVVYKGPVPVTSSPKLDLPSNSSHFSHLS